MNTVIVVLLAAGLLASVIALALDLRTSGARPRRPRGARSADVILAATTILAAGSLVAALACEALAPHNDSAQPITRVLTTALALALATVGGGPFAVLALRLATRGASRAGAHGGILIGENSAQAVPAAAPVPSSPLGIFRRRKDVPRTSPASPSQAMGTPAVEVLRGGTTIGVLERLAIAGSIVAGFPEAVAVIIAIKGVGRFSELAAPEAKERFIIGTLASFVWAGACALVLR